MVLLPKIDVPKEAKDFRPITLVHSFAKLVSKLLATRLSAFLPRLGDPLSPMLFIIAMDILDRLFKKAAAENILGPCGIIEHSCRIYADEVILFGTPSAQEGLAIAFGLCTNLQKCSITLIFGEAEQLAALQSELPCQLMSFPIKCLGVPLSTKSLPKSAIRPVIEKVAAKLTPWHGSLMNKSGRLVVVKSVASAVPIYRLMANNLPPWTIEKIDALRRNFLWTGSDRSARGKAMVAWPLVSRPTSVGGLGVLDLRLAGTALQARWL
ncbi:hypothetical protein C2845_PM10G21820 [Panicum miliaceum]|uniref:Reverse transcriptase domain-containing protein n=1 Tax=Panicum miliaceum TaxID=4540 RepID=A0A3L6PC01_PANMI|nr:hypothetical protein C2845_PM10G21820 [Panicum miliaceum]